MTVVKVVVGVWCVRVEGKGGTGRANPAESAPSAVLDFVLGVLSWKSIQSLLSSLHIPQPPELELAAFNF